MPDSAELTINETLPKPRRDTRFTKANAREMAARAHALRIAAAQRAAEQESLPPDQQQAKPEPDPFYRRTLARVRAQISKNLTLMEGEEDGSQLDRLASAIAKLEEIDRRFSDRSLPAVRRANGDKPAAGRASILLVNPTTQQSQGQAEQE